MLVGYKLRQIFFKPLKILRFPNYAKKRDSDFSDCDSCVNRTYWIYRRILCDVICLHLTMDCDPLTQQDKMLYLLSCPAILSPISQTTRIWRGFENSKFYSVYMSSLSVLPPSLAASFENLYNSKVYKANKQN